MIIVRYQPYNPLPDILNMFVFLIFAKPLIQVQQFTAKSSYIRLKDFRLFVRHAQGTPPWILKRGGLESSGRRLISSNGKTKLIVFFYYFFFFYKLN